MDVPLLLALLLAPPVAAGPCDLVTAAEIAKALAVSAVQLDSVNTGTSESTGAELCSWMVDPQDPRGIAVKLRRATSADQTEALLVGARIDEEMTPDRMTPVPGLGDGAHWGPWGDGSGGALIVRRGAVVLTVTGTVEKGRAVELARAALRRLPEAGG